MEDCVFCKIVSGEFPSAVLYEDDEFKVILDRFPAGAGHALIMPKTHTPDIFGIDPALAGRLFALAVKVAAAMKEALDFENMNLVQNNGPVAGQTVPHFHIHLIPRHAGDGVNVKWAPTDPSMDELEKVREKITAKMKI